MEVYPAEIVTIIGPNGSGKTTLLKILLGLTEADSGEIFQSPALKIGYVPQQVKFDSIMPLTAYDLLKLMERDHERIMQVAAEVEITRYLRRQLYALSGGELQRVMLAQALLTGPQLLVLDEPVQGVDFNGQATLYKLIREVARARGCAVLMVSHDLHLVMADTDHVICLNRHICCSGTPHDVSKDAEFINLFGAETAKQIAYYVHHHDHQHGMDGEVVMQATNTVHIKAPHVHGEDCQHEH